MLPARSTTTRPRETGRSSKKSAAAVGRHGDGSSGRAEASSTSIVVTYGKVETGIGRASRPDSWVVLTSLPPASLTEASGRALTTR